MTKKLTRTTLRRNPRAGFRRGFTVVELMMALAIFAIGVVGVVAMESLVASTNRHGRDLAVANQFARSWLDQLAMDASYWGGPKENLLSTTRWLKNVTTSDGTWIVPADSLDGTSGAGAEVRGEYVSVAGTTAPYFCAHARFTRLVGRQNVGLIRTEVRVFWPKGPNAYLNGSNTNYCDASALTAGEGSDTNNYHFVYQTSVVRETPAF